MAGTVPGVRGAGAGAARAPCRADLPPSRAAAPSSSAHHLGPARLEQDGQHPGRRAGGGSGAVARSAAPVGAPRGERPALGQRRGRPPAPARPPDPRAPAARARAPSGGCRRPRSGFPARPRVRRPARRHRSRVIRSAGTAARPSGSTLHGSHSRSATDRTAGSCTSTSCLPSSSSSSRRSQPPASSSRRTPPAKGKPSSSASSGPDLAGLAVERVAAHQHEVEGAGCPRARRPGPAPWPACRSRRRPRRRRAARRRPPRPPPRAGRPRRWVDRGSPRCRCHRSRGPA